MNRGRGNKGGWKNKAPGRDTVIETFNNAAKLPGQSSAPEGRPNYDSLADDVAINFPWKCQGKHYKIIITAKEVANKDEAGHLVFNKKPLCPNLSDIILLPGASSSVNLPVDVKGRVMKFVAGLQTTSGKYVSSMKEVYSTEEVMAHTNYAIFQDPSLYPLVIQSSANWQKCTKLGEKMIKDMSDREGTIVGNFKVFGVTLGDEVTLKDSERVAAGGFIPRIGEEVIVPDKDEKSGDGTVPSSKPVSFKSSVEEEALGLTTLATDSVTLVQSRAVGMIIKDGVFACMCTYVKLGDKFMVITVAHVNAKGCVATFHGEKGVLVSVNLNKMRINEPAQDVAAFDIDAIDGITPLKVCEAIDGQAMCVSYFTSDAASLVTNGVNFRENFGTAAVTWAGRSGSPLIQGGNFAGFTYGTIDSEEKRYKSMVWVYVKKDIDKQGKMVYAFQKQEVKKTDGVTLEKIVDTMMHPDAVIHDFVTEQVEDVGTGAVKTEYFDESGASEGTFVNGVIYNAEDERTCVSHTKSTGDLGVYLPQFIEALRKVAPVTPEPGIHLEPSLTLKKFKSEVAPYINSGKDIKNLPPLHREDWKMDEVPDYGTSDKRVVTSMVYNNPVYLEVIGDDDDDEPAATVVYDDNGDKIALKYRNGDIKMMPWPKPGHRYFKRCCSRCVSCLALFLTGVFIYIVGTLTAVDGKMCEPFRVPVEDPGRGLKFVNYMRNRKCIDLDGLYYRGRVYLRNFKNPDECENDWNVCLQKWTNISGTVGGRISMFGFSYRCNLTVGFHPGRSTAPCRYWADYERMQAWDVAFYRNCSAGECRNASRRGDTTLGDRTTVQAMQSVSPSTKEASSVTVGDMGSTTVGSTVSEMVGATQLSTAANKRRKRSVELDPEIENTVWFNSSIKRDIIRHQWFGDQIYEFRGYEAVFIHGIVDFYGFFAEPMDFIVLVFSYDALVLLTTSDPESRVCESVADGVCIQGFELYDISEGSLHVVNSVNERPVNQSFTLNGVDFCDFVSYDTFLVYKCMYSSAVNASFVGVGVQFKVATDVPLGDVHVNLRAYNWTHACRDEGTIDMDKSYPISVPIVADTCYNFVEYINASRIQTLIQGNHLVVMDLKGIEMLVVRDDFKTNRTYKVLRRYKECVPFRIVELYCRDLSNYSSKLLGNGSLIVDNGLANSSFRVRIRKRSSGAETVQHCISPCIVTPEDVGKYEITLKIGNNGTEQYIKYVRGDCYHLSSATLYENLACEYKWLFPVSLAIVVLLSLVVVSSLAGVIRCIVDCCCTRNVVRYHKVSNPGLGLVSLFCMSLRLTGCIGALVDVRNVGIGVKVDVNMDAYSGATEEFTVVGSTSGVGHVEIQDIKCSYAVDIKYWFSSYDYEIATKIACCTDASCPADINTGCHRHSTYHTEVYPCMWGMGGCFCCLSPYNSICGAALEFPTNDWRKDHYAIALEIKSSDVEAGVRLQVGNLDVESFVSGTHGMTTIFPKGVFRSTSINGVRCLENGKYVIYNNNLYRVDFPAFGQANPGVIGDVAGIFPSNASDHCNHMVHVARHVTFPRPQNDQWMTHTVVASGFDNFKEAVKKGLYMPVSDMNEHHCLTVLDYSRLDIKLNSYACHGANIALQFELLNMSAVWHEKSANCTTVSVSFGEGSCYGCDYSTKLEVSLKCDSAGRVSFLCSDMKCSQSVFDVGTGEQKFNLSTALGKMSSNPCITFLGQKHCHHYFVASPRTYVNLNGKTINGTKPEVQVPDFGDIWSWIASFFGSWNRIIGMILAGAALCAVGYLVVVYWPKKVKRPEVKRPKVDHEPLLPK